MPSPAAFVLLDEPTKLDTSRICESLTARHPGVPVSIPEDSGLVAAIVLKCADYIVALMDIAAPLPNGWQQVAHRAAMHSPEAEATCARHRAHSVVSVTGGGGAPTWQCPGNSTLTRSPMHRLGILFLNCLLLLLQMAQTVSAAGLENAIPNCPVWLTQADDFLADCQAHARYFTRTFYPSGGSRGEKEENSAWFASAPSDSHFLMGCTLRFDRTLSFLGLYYTAEPPAIVQADTAPILGIGFDGEVVLSVDGHPVTFTPVEPFDTVKVKTRWSGSAKTAVNCQSPLGQDGGYHLMRNDTFADFSRFDREGIVAVGGFASTEVATKFLEFFPSPIPREIIYSWFNVILVTTSGSLLVREESFPKACHQGVPERVANSPLLLHQLCRIQQTR